MALRLAFLGTPEFATPALAELIGEGHDVACVYTRAPRPKGRGLAEEKSPVHKLAEAAGIPVRTPRSLKDTEEQAALPALKHDAAVVVAYGLILPKPILDAPRLGCFNLHASLLPRWRGAAPIQRAIMAGDSETGVMVMKMDAGLDTGDVALAARVHISDMITEGDLRHVLAGVGAKLMAQAMDDLEHRQLNLIRQSEIEETYATKIDKTETRIDWGQPARKVLRHIHGLSPSPGAWCEMPIGNQAARV